MGGGAQEPHQEGAVGGEEGRVGAGGPLDVVRGLIGEDVVGVVLVGVVVDHVAVLVEGAAQELARDPVPLVPAGGHVGLGVAVHVLAEEARPVALLLQPGRHRGVLVAEEAELLEAPARGLVGEHLVVVDVLAPQGGRPGGAAQGVGDERVLEGGAALDHLLAQVGHVLQVAYGSVVRHDQDDVRTLGLLLLGLRRRLALGPRKPHHHTLRRVAQAPRAPGPQQAQKLCYTFWRCASPLTQGPYEGGRGRRRGGPGVLFDLIRAVPVALIVGLVPGYFWARCLAATDDLAERLAYATALSVTLVPAVALILSSVLGTGVTTAVSLVSVAVVFFAGLAARLLFGTVKGPAGPISALPSPPGVAAMVPLCLALVLALVTFFGLAGGWTMIPSVVLVVVAGVVYWLSLRGADGAAGARPGDGEAASPGLLYSLLAAALVLALARGYLGPILNGWPFPRGVDRYEHAIMTSMIVDSGSTESFMLYPPGFHALSAMISNLSGLEPMALFPALAPSLLALTSLSSYALAARLWGRPAGVAAAFLSGPVLGGAYLHFEEARYPNFVGEQIIIIVAVPALIGVYANPTVRAGLLLAVLG